ncbi:MAG: hypothetical protein JWL67_979 [Solirubrobacterales bacterium]|nr:hypothetical protein [Solirubrobacterales bacterium]
MSAERPYARTRVAAVVASAAVAAALAGGPAVAEQGRSADSTPSVQTMIVGPSGALLAPPRTVAASRTTVRIGHSQCAVAAGTPLAALAAERRTGAPGFALRDYGRCGASTANSGQLFVYAIGGQRNSGQNGWEYKVDNVSGSTGAGDPSGPLGNGRRLRTGARVLWFWCHAAGGGCQRTLAAASPAVASARASLTVTVTGYDNGGRGIPIAGAIVMLGSDFASTDSRGRATLIAPPSPGRYPLVAGRRGMVPSFPETIVVR